MLIYIESLTQRALLQEFSRRILTMSTLIRWEPARDIPALRGRMDRLFNEFLGRNWGGEEGLATGVWIPQVDVFETPENIVLKADLPDVKKDDVEISIQNSTLTLKGERK